jgi:hypothetical protein
MLEGIAPRPKKTIGPCLIFRRADELLDEADKKILFDALENKMFSNLGLAEQLNQRGFPISENVIRKHRVGKCSCARRLED